MIAKFLSPILMLTKNLILNWTHKIKLPLKVRSTAFQLCDKLDGFFKTIDHLQGFEAKLFKAKVCIFLGCKFEDIHGHLNKMMEQLEIITSTVHLPNILELEAQIIEYLNFQFDFPNLYQSTLAVHLLVSESTKIPWETTIECLNKALLSSNLETNLMEVVLSSFPDDSYIHLDLKYNNDIINEIKKRAVDIKYLSDREIKLKCEKTT